MFKFLDNVLKKVCNDLDDGELIDSNTLLIQTTHYRIIYEKKMRFLSLIVQELNRDASFSYRDDGDDYEFVCNGREKRLGGLELHYIFGIANCLEGTKMKMNKAYLDQSCKAVFDYAKSREGQFLKKRGYSR